jgi:hypothetical protein
VAVFKAYTLPSISPAWTVLPMLPGLEKKDPVAWGSVEAAVGAFSEYSVLPLPM